MTTDTTTGGTSRPDPLHLTRLVLNPRHPDVRRDLRDATALHRTLMRLLPDDLGEAARHTAAALHRTDTYGPRTVVLLQSEPPADPELLPVGYLAEAPAVKDISRALASLAAGMTVRYRILANPTRAIARPRPADGTPVRGKRTAVPAADLPDWWDRKASAAGLQPNPLATIYSNHPTIRASRPNGRPALHAAVRIDGAATITDPDHLRAAVRAGIGPGKAHGLGLLSLAPARP